jgi:hypothetical protein
MPASPELAGRKLPIGTGTKEKKQIEHQAALWHGPVVNSQHQNWRYDGGYGPPSR